MSVRPGHAPCDQTKNTEGNLGQPGNSIHVEDCDDQVVSEAEVIWAEDERGQI
jgi:hypothetical protein